jgi:tight adherence protein B
VVRVIAVAAGLAAAVLVLARVHPPARRAPSADTEPRLRAPSLSAAVLVLADRLMPGRRIARRDAQLPDALDRLAAALRAGRAIGPALADLATEVADPLRAELRGVTRAVEGGLSLSRALEGWAGAPGASADVRLVAAALTVGASAGGQVARAVDGIAATLRDRASIAAEVRALSTQARSSAVVLAIAPPAFTALIATIEPSSAAFLITTPVGLACLIVGLGLDALGAVWMARITRAAA